jgi:hypothetical protein
MERKMLIDESLVFDACALVEQIVKQLTTTSCLADTVVPFVLEKASKASLLLNQAMKEGELV